VIEFDEERFKNGFVKPMKSPSKPENGIIAILDALGAANYGDTEIKRFIDSRQVVLQLLNQKAEDIFGEIRASMITTFTFNDTVLIILRTGAEEPRLKQISDFFRIMRKFIVDSLAHRILFRGSIAIGTFYANDETNTVMGQAVTDAAAWYDKADWIGVHATPRANLVIDRCLKLNNGSGGHGILDYDVPLKGGMVVRTKAVNWPKVFYIDSISPCESGTEPKQKLLEFLTQHQVPLGTENKFYNTIAFFDSAANQIMKQKRKPRSRSNR
jgi:hypothetical protein